MQTSMWYTVSVVIFLAITSFCSAQLPHVKCRTKHKKIGCFDQSLSGATLLFSDHVLGGPNNKGYEIDWYNWNDYMHSLACRCNEEALQNNHTYFLLDYLGSCLGAKELSNAVNRSSLACIGRDYAQCNDSNSFECVGNDRNYFMYEVGRDGGYGEWGEFSPCSQTCDVGVKKRTRNCTNPVPTGLGRNCSYVGPKLDTASCNLIYCRDINECESNPCRNGGVCIDQLNRYTCSCPGGYTGTHCERDVNECATSPCSYGETCYNNIGSYRCVCHWVYRYGRCQRPYG